MASLFHLYYNSSADFERLFDDAFNAHSQPSSCHARGSNNVTRHSDSFRPRMDVKENKDSNVVTATFELPGLQSEDIAIDLQHNRLTISGESTTSGVLEKSGYVVRERCHGKFARTVELPFGTKPEDVKARLENGVLTVTFPKSTPEQQPQHISIQ